MPPRVQPSHSSYDINGDDESQPLIPINPEASIKSFLRTLQEYFPVDSTINEPLSELKDQLIARINGERQDCCTSRDTFVDGLHTVLAYCAALKGAIGAAALIELIATKVLEKSADDDAAFNDTHVWPALLAAEIIVGVLALALNLPFYFKNVRDGLVALNIARPSSMGELELREKIQQMSWARYILSFGLALGAGLGQAGMVSLNTFFLTRLESLTGISANIAKWFLGGPVGVANVVMYLPKTGKAIDNLTDLFSTERPWSERLKLVLEYAVSVVAVVPNVLGAGTIFSDQMSELDPDYQKMIIFISGTLMSIGPIGLNIDELEKITKAKDTIIQQLREKYPGYLSAAVSASFSCIFTYNLVLKVFGSNIGSEAAAIGLTLFNSLLLVLTKGNPFAEHYKGTNCGNLLKKLFGANVPLKAEARWKCLLQSLEKLKELNTASSERHKTKVKNIFVDDFKAFIALLPEVKKVGAGQRQQLIELAENFVGARLSDLPLAPQSSMVMMLHQGNSVSPAPSRSDSVASFGVFSN